MRSENQIRVRLVTTVYPGQWTAKYLWFLVTCPLNSQFKRSPIGFLDDPGIVTGTVALQL